MNSELQATTDAGRKFVGLAEEHGADFATRADQHDREASFPHENIKAMQESGFLAGPVPEQFGGMGVASVLDMMIGMSRLGRGCASTAIATQMHMAGAWETSRIWRGRENAPPELAAAVENVMRGIAGKQVIGCAGFTEAGTDLSAPMTEATKVDDGYAINGRKIFGTMSPAANIIFTAVRIRNGEGNLRSIAIVPLGAPGVTIHNNWDAMGMRASASHDITFEDVRVPDVSVLGGLPWGKVDANFAEMNASVNLGLISTFLGMAEAARDYAVEMTKRRKGPSGKLLAERIPIQQLIGEIEIELAAARAIVERTGRVADEYFQRNPFGTTPPDEAFEQLKQNQCMKWTVQRNAINIVDKAMTATGGSAYLAGNPLSRLYRDVRAGPFMQPFAPYEALEFIGKVTLGLDPQLDR
jgi:alkylation response protein AidB-like acyl-CoA dehydrogenase